MKAAARIWLVTPQAVAAGPAERHASPREIKEFRTPGRRRVVAILTSPSVAPCGVEAFARGLADAAASEELETRMVPVSGRPGDIATLWRALRGADALMVNLPVVAWKKALATPLIALLFARLLGGETIVTLHEWSDLKLSRRLVCAVYVLLAQTLLFSSPTVREQFRSSPLARFKPAGGLLPIPPNLAPPAMRRRGPLVDRLEAERARGRLILGHFGSIYPKKRCAFALDVAAALRDVGQPCHVVFIGGVVPGEEALAFKLRAHAQSLGIADDLSIAGFVPDSESLFGLFEACDAFVYSFEGGLTSRRGSVLACLEAGRPVVVNAPEGCGEFDHHPVYQEILANGALRLVATDAPPNAYAQAILHGTANGRRIAEKSFYEQAWREAARALIGSLKR